MENKFVFPSNVKQIGSIDEDIKIYVEDFAYTYICQYARAEAYKEKLAVLVGQYTKLEGKNVVLISGIIQGKYTANAGGNEVFTEETWEYIQTRKERYFKDFEIVGWLHTQPGNGTYVPEEDKVFHKENFSKAYQVLFVMDCTERMDAFFVSDPKLGLRELAGYFIYYDKNENMQEYMLDNKLVKSRSYNYQEEEEEAPKEDVIVNYRRHEKEKKIENRQKKLTNLLVSTSGIVVVLCFFMGLLLLQNAQRMSQLEQQLADVNKVYKQLGGDSTINNKHLAPVFASQEESIPQKQSEPSKEEEAVIKEKETKSVQESQTETHTTPQPIITETKATQETVAVATQASLTVATQTKKDIPQTHIVKSGDTLSGISTYYYGTKKMVDSIMQYNNIKNADKVYEGMTLKLPPN
jgi:LysM repeat protein/proteasome lid subunit RPN8/RPN11